MPEEDDKKLDAVKTEWGKLSDDHFGYASEKERLEKRGMEDWELVEKIPQSQKRVPKWFIAVIVMVMLVAFGLTLPFWGDRPDNPRPWFTWGTVAAVVYFGIAAGFIYFMVNLYGSDSAGRLDNDPDREDEDDVDMPK
ncbi:MAG TPA: hypothetical protein VNI58_00925 [Mariprofundaceae bacterium]|nr:hypothetical protein [Mariprofundaceae bacterium]